jgi:hypothetical protein
MNERDESWFNFEKGVFFAFAVLLCYACAQYAFNRPPAVESLLELPRASLADSAIKRASDIGSYLAQVTRDRNIFVLPHLARTKLTPIQQQAVRPHPPINNPVRPPVDPKAEKVVLPSKPKQVAETVVEQEDNPDKPEESPFPLKLVGILQVEEGRSERLALVMPIDGGAETRRLAAGEEWRGSELVRVERIEPTSVTFLRENGKVHKIDLDPLKDWKPVLREVGEESLSKLEGELKADEVRQLKEIRPFGLGPRKGDKGAEEALPQNGAEDPAWDEIEKILQDELKKKPETNKGAKGII